MVSPSTFNTGLNPIVTPDKQIFELLQGRVLFKGRPDPNGAWTAEEDHLAQIMELFGPLPTDLLAEGRSSGSFSTKTVCRNFIYCPLVVTLIQLLLQFVFVR